MDVVIITGPPYSGKGTQCELLKSQLSYTHISTGERIRKEKAERTAIGQIMSSYEEQGNLVPDEIMQDLLEQILDENVNEKGIILDGYPRTIIQVDTLLNLLYRKNLPVKKVINIDVTRDELLVRAKKRAETSNRKDDQDINTHLKRIDVFEHDTRPAIEYMKTRLQVKDINGLGSIESITEAIGEAISGK
jgi:adenylate kinase